MTANKPTFGDSFRYLIIDRIKNFWGYGNLDSDVWLVGMEEGYGEKNESLEHRFKATSGAQVFDVYEDLKIDPGHVFWFEEGAPTQSTYRKLIYIYLYLQNREEPHLEDIRKFQIKELGRKKSNHALLELMPLPSRSIQPKDWLYTDAFVEGLSSRKEYLKTYKPERVKALGALIKKHKPKIVLFYSFTYLKEWGEVIGVELQQVIPKRLYTAKDNDTMYIVVPHSTSRGVSNAEWKNIAEKIIELR